METIIRNIEPRDKDFVLELNRVNVEVLSPMDEEKLRGILRFANCAASLTTSRPGAIPAMPTRSEVEAVLKAAE